MVTETGGLPHEAGVRQCRHCGALIGKTLFAREGDGYCCEGCCLARYARTGLGQHGEDVQSALVEALAAALDAREREIGLHSKRVACHTLLLARQFTMDAAELRQVGTQFDPIAVDAFVREDATVREMVAMKCGEAVLPVPSVK